jgi:TonB family protein
MNTPTAQSSLDHLSNSVKQTALSFVLGIGFTFLLFLGIAHFEKASPDAAVTEIEDLTTVAIPVQPPPPPTEQPREVHEEASSVPLSGLDLSPSDSPIKISVSPPELDFIMPPAQLAPPATIAVGSLIGTFKPDISTDFDASHVFQQNEVDRIPTVLYREVPSIPSRVRHNAGELRVVVLIIVDANGVVSSVRAFKPSGTPEFDTIIVQDVLNKWSFTPAVRKGKKVRCLLQQAITIKWSDNRSPFQI